MVAAVLAVSVMLVAVVTLTPDPSTPRVGRFCVMCGSPASVDAILNVLLFVPFGLGLALAGRDARTSIALAFLFSSGIELVQFFAIAGRISSIGDVLTNTIGGAVGFLLGRHLGAIVIPRPAVARRLALAWLAAWLGFQAVAAYSMVPWMPGPPYYLHVTRKLGDDSIPFPGTLLAASVGTEALSEWNLPNAGRLKPLLENGGPIHVRAVSTGASSGLSELVSVSGLGMGLILNVQQEGRDLLFSLNTGADIFRLRPYVFEVRDVFGASPSPDTVSIAATYHRTGVRISTEGRAGRRDLQFVPRAAQGWRLLAPYQARITTDRRETLAAMLCIALLIVPAAYWGSVAFLRREGSSRAPALPLGGFVFVLALGFAVIPATLGLRVATIGEWLVVLLASGAGFALARVAIAATSGRR